MKTGSKEQKWKKLQVSPSWLKKDQHTKKKKRQKLSPFPRLFLCQVHLIWITVGGDVVVIRTVLLWYQYFFVLASNKLPLEFSDFAFAVIRNVLKKKKLQQTTNNTVANPIYPLCLLFHETHTKHLPTRYFTNTIFSPTVYTVFESLQNSVITVQYTHADVYIFTKTKRKCIHVPIGSILLLIFTLSTFIIKCVYVINKC